jgi:quinol monooxygenase YgiN
MPIYMTARFTVRPETLAECLLAIEEFVAYVNDNEPNTRLYASLQSADDPHTFLHFFIFADERARDLHARSEGVARFTAALYPNLVEPTAFTTYRLVAATDRLP